MLITGKRDSGKTYLIKRIITNYNNHTIKTAGFFTEKTNAGIVTLKVWDNFCLIDNGPTMVLWDEKDKMVRKNVFEELGVWAVSRALEYASLVVMDELGRFEIDCHAFVNTVHKAFDSELALIAAVKDEKNPFIDSLLNRKDILLYKIDSGNRETLFHTVQSELNTILS